MGFVGPNTLKHFVEKYFGDYKKIQDIGDGTVTDAIASINNSLDGKIDKSKLKVTLKQFHPTGKKNWEWFNISNISIPAGVGVIIMSAYCQNCGCRVGSNGLPGQWSASSQGEEVANFVYPYQFDTESNVQIIAMIAGEDDSLFCDFHLFSINTIT